MNKKNIQLSLNLIFYRICQQCGKIYTRKKFKNGRMDSPAIFEKRRFCSVECTKAARREGKINIPQPPFAVTDRALEYRVRKFLKEKCEICGSKRKLQTHHIDHNKRNSNEENIQTLCKRCHDRHHATNRVNNSVISRSVKDVEAY